MLEQQSAPRSEYFLPSGTQPAVVDVVGEFYHADAIQAVISGINPEEDGSFRFAVTIVPEPDNHSSAAGTALSVRHGDEVLGYIPESLSPAYFPEFSRVYKSGAIAMTMAKALVEPRLDGAPGFQLRLALSDPNTNVPANDPPGDPWALLPFGEELAVETAPDAGFAKQNLPQAVLVTVHERAGQTVALLDVYVDGAIYGRLRDTDSEDLLPLVRHYEALGLIVAGYATADSQGRLFVHSKRAAQASEDDLEPQVSPLPPLISLAPLSPSAVEPAPSAVPQSPSPFAAASNGANDGGESAKELSNPFLDPRPQPQAAPQPASPANGQASPTLGSPSAFSYPSPSAPTTPTAVPAQRQAPAPAAGPSPYGSPYSGPYGLSPQEESPLTVANVFSEQINRPAMWLLWLFTGVLGGHRFYLGNYGIGTLQLLTCGGFGVWTLADAFLISNRARNIENGVEPRWKF